MEQLLEIRTVPIVIKCSVNREPVEKTDLTADIELSRNDDGFALRCRSISVDLDSFKNKQSYNDESNFESANQEFSASAMFAKNGEISVDYQKILNQTSHHKVAAPKMDFDIEQLNVQYEMDKAHFDMKMSEASVQFTPADVEFTIEQRPEVIIKYIGGPIYVPPSADPDYEPEVDVKA